MRRTSLREYQPRPSRILKARLRAELSLALSGHGDALTLKVSTANVWHKVVLLSTLCLSVGDKLRYSRHLASLAPLLTSHNVRLPVV